MDGFQRLSIEDHPDPIREDILSQLTLGDDYIDQDVPMEDVSLQDITPDYTLGTKTHSRRNFYSKLLFPSREGCRMASGRTDMPDIEPFLVDKLGKHLNLGEDHVEKAAEFNFPVDVNVGANQPDSTVDTTMTDDPADDTAASGVSDDDSILCLSTSDGIVDQTTIHNESEEYDSHGQLRARNYNHSMNQPIFISQNNYIQNYHHHGNGEIPKPLPQKIEPDDAGPVWKRPYLLSTYLQITLNTLISIYALYQCYLLFRTIKQDISVAVDREKIDSTYKIQQCYKHYQENHCADQSLPALQTQCLTWLKCMNKEPYMLINYSQLAASILGSLLNNFLESFSYKSLSLLAFVIFAIYASNFSFGYIRAKSFYGLPFGKSSPITESALIKVD